MKENKRLGEIKTLSNGCVAKIIEYNNCHDITIEFQDKYKAKIHTKYCHFKNENIKKYIESKQGVKK